VKAHNWTPASQKATYWRLRAEDRCVRCRGQMLDEWKGNVRCPACIEYQRDARAKYGKSKKGKESQRRWRSNMPRDRVERGYQRLSAARQRRKVEGICRTCPKFSLEDSVYCEPCRTRHRAEAADYARRKRKARLTGKPLAPPVTKKRRVPVLVVPIVAPVAEHIQLELPLRTRILRVARHFDELTNADVRDYLGLPDEAGNAVSSHLSRLAKVGHLERLDNRRGADAAYRLTAEGRRAA